LLKLKKKTLLCYLIKFTAFICLFVCLLVCLFVCYKFWNYWIFTLTLKENDRFIQLTTLISNFMGQAYYIVEHIAWARDKKIISGSSAKLWTVGIIFWLISLCISVAQSLWHLKNLKREFDSSEDDSDAMQWYYVRKRQLIVTIIGSLADGCNAVNWLPKGFLWSGQFSTSVIGLMGTISSAALMYNYLKPVPQKENEEGNMKKEWCTKYVIIIIL